MDHRPICAPKQAKTARHAPHAPGQSSQRKVTGSLARAGLLKGVAARSHDHQGVQDVQFGVWGQGIQRDIWKGKTTPPISQHSTTLDATPTFPLGINSLLTSTATSSLMEPHPLHETASAPSFEGQQFGGQRSRQYGVGVASQKTTSIGRLRRGCMAGAVDRRNKVNWVSLSF